MREKGPCYLKIVGGYRSHLILTSQRCFSNGEFPRRDGGYASRRQRRFRKRSAAMVGMIAQDAPGAVELFRQKHAHQRMRQGQR